ncbi:MAG TPA: hypothetical protein VMW16_09610 [Sedimentisphaerales bacterium]|nr:hypothetical protein [Sedimentisphaerales bacterium]
MKKGIVGLALVLLLAGCESGGPAVSKSEMGNLQINVYCPEEMSTAPAEIYLDGVFIGNATGQLPVIHARRGKRVVRVEAAGCKPYEKSITILGEPNHQVLNVYLERQ